MGGENVQPVVASDKQRLCGASEHLAFLGLPTTEPWRQLFRVDLQGAVLQEVPNAVCRICQCNSTLANAPIGADYVRVRLCGVTDIIVVVLLLHAVLMLRRQTRLTFP